MDLETKDVMEEFGEYQKPVIEVVGIASSDVVRTSNWTGDYQNGLVEGDPIVK